MLRLTLNSQPYKFARLANPSVCVSEKRLANLNVRYCKGSASSGENCVRRLSRCWFCSCVPASDTENARGAHPDCTSTCTHEEYIRIHTHSMQTHTFEGEGEECQQQQACSCPPLSALSVPSAEKTFQTQIARICVYRVSDRLSRQGVLESVWSVWVSAGVYSAAFTFCVFSSVQFCLARN